MRRTSRRRSFSGSPSRSTFYSWKKGAGGNLSRDAFERVSYVIGIYKALQILFADKAQADAWVSKPNAAFRRQVRVRSNDRGQSWRSPRGPCLPRSCTWRPFVKATSPPVRIVRWHKDLSTHSDSLSARRLVRASCRSCRLGACRIHRGLTNDRLRDEIGDIAIVPLAERLAGPGASPIVAAFTHIGFPSRFTDGSFGVYYACKSFDGASTGCCITERCSCCERLSPHGVRSEDPSRPNHRGPRTTSAAVGRIRSTDPDSYVHSQTMAKRSAARKQRNRLRRCEAPTHGEHHGVSSVDSLRLPRSQVPRDAGFTGSRADGVFKPGDVAAVHRHARGGNLETSLSVLAKRRVGKSGRRS